MCVRYRNVGGFEHCPTLYQSFLDDCDAHRLIREKYKDLLKLERRNSREVLNPTDIDIEMNLAAFLDEIQEKLIDLEMF